MPQFNLKYAKWIPGVRDEVAELDSIDGLNDDQLNLILGLATVGEYNFGSGPWLFTTQQCDADDYERLDLEPTPFFYCILSSLLRQTIIYQANFITRDQVCTVNGIRQ